MDKKTAEIALQFLQRAQLSGQEVGSFIEVTRALHAIASGLVTISPMAQDQNQAGVASGGRRSASRAAVSQPA